MPKTMIPGYSVNQVHIYSGLYTIIYSGLRNLDKQNVVIKFLKNEHPSPDDIARFKHEYEIAKEFEEEVDIVHVSGLEKYENSYAIVMENINAPTLGEILLKEKKLKINDFLELAIQMTEAIGHIHQHNVIHKDINPSNIMNDLIKHQIKIIDFGLSANLPKERAEIVSPNVLEGTLAYISPEQTGRMNRGIDYRTDYYSLGITFYQMLVGTLPFTSQDPMELVHCHIAVVPKSPHEIDSSIPKIVSDIIIKLLSKKAEDRYQNANGLLADLKECRDQLNNTGRINSFPLGQKDIFSRFQIPEVLYGRENEVKTLMDTYEQVTQGNVELMLVAGYSGIGKSALVHEIHKPIVHQHGYFISGKFDQFRHNIPYAAITQAFEEFVNLILSESEERIDSFRKKILDAVGENAQVIIDVIPNLISIIGKQNPVKDLGPTESQNRFSYTFQNFIKALAGADHPLVIFLDDLQWADLPSLKMIDTLLTSQDCHYLFIIGAYRSNEVNAAHPLMVTLSELQKRNVIYKSIELQPLAISHVTELLADTLHQEKDSVTPLANICFEKTSGNPFFLIQLLTSLYKEQLIQFDTKNNSWVWDLDKIHKTGITDNVVHLMVSKIKELNQTTQQDLQYASCIGNKFDLDLLSSILKKPSETVLIELQEALKEGYIVSHGDSYKAVSYHFAHDRIQQAANSLIEENDKKLIHINLARLILKKTEKDKLDDVIFDVVNHYNISLESEIPKEIDDKEKNEIAQLNLIATKTAKTAAAFDPSLKYAEYGLKCLGTNAWDSNYDLALNLNTEAAEAAYLTTKYDVMENYAEATLQQTKNIFDELKIIQTKVLAFIAQSKHRSALTLIVNTLSRLGINLPHNPNLGHVLYTIFKMKFTILGKKISSLVNLPDMVDPAKKAAVNLMTIGTAPAYQGHPNLLPLLVCTNVILSVRYGNAKQSPYSYASYGIIACGILGEIDTGYQFGELAFNLLEKMHDEETRTKITMINYIFIKHWKDWIRDLLPKLKENYEKGLDAGDLEYACYSGANYCLYSYFSGVQLKDLLTKISTIYEPSLRNLQQMNNLNYTLIVYQTVLDLIGKDIISGSELLSGKIYSEKNMVQAHIDTNDKTALAVLYVFKLSLLYLYERDNEFTKCIENFDTYADALVSTFFVPAYHFYRSLALLRLHDSSQYNMRRKILKKVKTSQKQMQKWAKFAPKNHTHKWQLVEAEKAWRIDHDYEKASRLFDQAIETAKMNEFLNDEALGNELAAIFYLHQGKEKVSRVYMEDARHCYLLWGADGKVAHLDKKYPNLLARTQSSASSATISTTVSTSASDRAASETLDIGTIQKSSKIISSTIVLNELLKRLMHIVIENAGAQKSYLLLNKDGKYLIEAEGNVSEQEAKVLKSLTPTTDILPVSIINYVIHSKESIVLDNAVNSERFMNDVYIAKNKPKSILCMPLLNQGVLTGILYLENNLTEKAFTEDRIKVLYLLSSQIAISIDNARLYSNTKDLNEQLIILNKAFERFVPQDFLSLLERKNIVEVQLGDQVQENMTVLFTDIRNFTTLSESMSPNDNFKFINSFLGVMAPVIRKYNGFVDKYIGDAIMALYPRSADDAVQCALEMQKSLNEFNQKRTDEGRFSVGIGIGINTGLLMLGTVGETNRMNATVISDAVNIASRIESLTKTYQTPILISEDTFKQLKNPARYNIKMVDNKVLVKGKSKPIAVYSVVEN